jgi:phosphoketolase
MAAETGPLATGWHSNKFLNPQRDGCVLPILRLNGYKIANPCFLARILTMNFESFSKGTKDESEVIKHNKLPYINRIIYAMAKTTWPAPNFPPFISRVRRLFPPPGAVVFSVR